LKFALGRLRPVARSVARRSSPPEAVASALGGVMSTYAGGIKPRCVAFSAERFAVKGKKGKRLAVQAASTRFARLSTVSLDPNLGEYLRRRHQASVGSKVADCTGRVALKVVSQALGGRAAPSMNWRCSTRSARLSRVARSQSSALHRAGRDECGEPSARRAVGRRPREIDGPPPVPLAFRPCRSIPILTRTKEALSLGSPKSCVQYVGSQALSVRAALSRKWRTSTRFARLSTVSLDPDLDEDLRRRPQASVVPKVAYCTDRVALTVASQAIGGPGGALEKLADLDQSCSPFDRFARSQS
jgi:hypothetical protein